jgi:hypothetical protein
VLRGAPARANRRHGDALLGDALLGEGASTEGGGPGAGVRSFFLSFF